MIRDIVTFPDGMILRRTTKPGVKLEAALVVIFGLLGAAGMAYVGSQAFAAYEGDGASLRFEFIGAALRPLAVLAALWIGYTVLSHVFASFFGGRGPIIRLFRASAWALIPMGIWFAIRSLVIGALYFGVTFPADPEGMGAEEEFQSLMELGLDSPVYLVTIILGIVFALWSGHLLSIAVEEAKGISSDDARKIAAVPTAFVCLYILWAALGVAGVV